MDAVALPVAGHAFVRRHHAPRRLLLLVPLLALGVGLVLANQPRPTFASAAGSTGLSLTQPATFTFTWPVARTIRLAISPHVDGELSYGNPLTGNRLFRSITFTPALTWQPDTAYRITLSDVESAVPGLQRLGEYSFSFTTAPTPAIASISPSHDAILNADSSWRVSLDRPVERTSNFTFTVLPDMPVRSGLSEDGLHYVVIPVQLLPQGQEVHLRVQRTDQRLAFGTTEVAEQGEPREVAARSWPVRVAPGVTNFSPQGTNAALTAPISVTLSEATALDTFTQAAALSPVVVGEWQTTDQRTFTLAHEPLAQRTTYTLQLAGTLRTIDGGFLPERAQSQFTTVGPVLLAGSTPRHNATGVSVRNAVQVTFDQPVDHADAIQRFRIAPAVTGKTAWQGNTLTFTPTSTFAFDTAYAVTFAKGVVGSAGYPSESALTVRFTTEHATTKLAVPYHRQDHALSCEVATLVMALRYRGVSIGEQTLIDAIGFDPTPKKNGVWGDPDVAFVGDIDGQQPGTGYGVYAAPIAKAGSAYRPTRVLTNTTLADLLTEVKAGNPVIVWGNAASGRRVDWKTPTGKTVLAIVGEHTRVVIGYTGSASNPATIITLDPLVGEKRFTKTAFLADWALLGNMGVVVE